MNRSRSRKVLLMTGHTPIPWKRNNKVGYVFGPDCVVARCGDFSDKTPHLVEMNGDRWNADADFIVEAVNSIDALRADNARLRAILEAYLDDTTSGWECDEMARAALSTASDPR